MNQLLLSLILPVLLLCWSCWFWIDSHCCGMRFNTVDCSKLETLETDLIVFHVRWFLKYSTIFKWVIKNDFGVLTSFFKLYAEVPNIKKRALILITWIFSKIAKLEVGWILTANLLTTQQRVRTSFNFKFPQLNIRIEDTSETFVR